MSFDIASGETLVDRKGEGDRELLAVTKVISAIDNGFGLDYWKRNTVARCVIQSRSRSSCNCRRVSASRAPKGSSSNNTSGSNISERARAAR